MSRHKNVLSIIFSGALIFGGVSAFSYSSHAMQGFSDLVPAHSFANQVSEDSAAGAKNFIGSMTERGINFLGNESLSDKQRAAEFKKLLRDSFDMKTIARFAIGKYWRTANDAQKKEYLQLFEKMVISVYSRRFSEYGGQDLEVTGARGEGKADTMVSSKIVSSGSPTVKVDWRVRYKDGRYKVIDIMVEGVSMALTHRSDFSSVIQRGGGDIEVLLDHLRKS